MDDYNIYVPIVKIKQVRQTNAKYNHKISRPEDIIEMLYPMYRDIDREIFIVVGLDTSNRPNVINIVSIGTLNSTAVSPREVFKPLILSNCASFICVHNHVSGQLIPSECDKNVTRVLISIGNQLNINLVDHLIVNASKEHYSFANTFLLKNLS
jgi:DNA repair protein RadC